MKYYGFRQNNSGGSFDHDPDNGIGYAVAIQAISAEHANFRARQIGIYFDGIEAGVDCACCGDRWYAASEDDAYDEPGIYSSGEIKGGWRIPSYAHHIDGTVTEYPPE